MVFPCDTPTRAELLKDALSAARRVRDVVAQRRNLSNSTFEDVRVCTFGIQDAQVHWSAAAGRTGMGAYAQSALDQGSLDFVAEYNAMNSAANTFVAWIDANWPSDPYTKDANGRVVPKTLTAGERSAFQTQADLFLATLSTAP